MTSKEAKEIVAFVAELIRGKRAFHRLGLRQLSKVSGVSLATLSRIERGGIPDAITFIKLIAWLRERT